jgi:DNA polymerase beta
VYQLKRYPNKITAGKEVLSLPNVGKKMVEKIDEIISTNELQTLNKLRELYKSSSTTTTTTTTTTATTKNNISKILGFGVKKADEIKKKFKLETLSDLENYIKNHSDEDLNLTTQQKIGMKHHRDLMTKIPRSEATKLYKKVNKIVSSSSNRDIKDNKLDLELAGSFASSYTKESKDIDILITTNKYKSKSSLEKSNILSLIVEELIYNKLIINTISLGKTKFLGLIQLTPNGTIRHLDMRIVNPQSYIYSRLYYTSGATFNKMMREKAKKANYKLNEWGLYERDTNKQVPSIKTEEDIFKKINMDYVTLDERR